MASRRSKEFANRRQRARKRNQESNLQLEALEPKVLLAGDTSSGVAQIISVVPQPITRTGSGALVQANNQIVVHFNDVDLLDSVTSAENPALYQLIYTNDTITNTDDTIYLPTSVNYSAATDRAVLTFSTDISALNGGDAAFRLRINTAPTLPSAPDAIDHALDTAGSSFSTAISATGSANGTLTGAVVIDAAIEPQDFALPFPGSDDEPGMRTIPNQEHYTLNDPADAVSGITTIPYNFQTFYGFDPAGNPLRNAITETQKTRAREVFDIYGTMFGVQFYETESEGYTVATGDLRALQTTFQTSGVGGIVAASGSTSMEEFKPAAIMDLAEPWNDSFGGSWYQAAMREISHLLGIGVTPEVSGSNIVGNLSESESAVTITDSTGTSRLVTSSRFVDFNPFGAEIHTDDIQFGITAERIFPGDATTILGQHLHRPDSVDIDLYRFRLNSSGRFSAETIAERLPDSSLLDTNLTLFNSAGQVISSNDDYFSEDSLIDLTLDAGTYYIGVTASGNTQFNPVIENTGLNGTSDGPYRLRLDFKPESSRTILDTLGRGLDGDADGTPGGIYNFWFEANSTDRTIYVDKSASAGGAGSLQAPFNNISVALAAAAQGSGDIVRIVGNGGADGNINTLGDNLAYELGFDNFGQLPDGASLSVPSGVTVMIDEGAIFKMRRSFVQVGSSTINVERSGAALQILGTPDADVIFTSREDESIGVDNEPLQTTPEAGEWGGIIIRNDLDRVNFKLDPETGAPRDFEAKGIFLNYINNADIRYGGGNVTIDSVQEVINPIHLIDSRPTIAFNDITFSADAAISANPDSFEESRFHAPDSLDVFYQSVPFTSTYDRIGPDIVGNVLRNNTTNALSIRIDTLPGDQLEELTVSGRFDDTSIVHVMKENLLIGATPGGPIQRSNGLLEARPDAQLVVDPGIVVKLDGARIDVEVSTQLIAEGSPDNPVIFTSINDNRYGGVTEVSTGAEPGDWGGIHVAQAARLSLDNVVIAYGGGVTRVPGSSTAFNALEIHQAEAARVTNSVFENNDLGVGGIAEEQRVGHGTHGPGAIFVRGAQPVIIGNTITNTTGTLAAAINIDVNSLNSTLLPDYGRSRGRLSRFVLFDDNQGPLIRENVLGQNTLNGMAVRGGVVTTEVVWDDTDIVHIVADQIVIPNYFSNGGVRLESSPTQSLVVKLDGNEAGFTATGTPLEIDDRIGGILNIVGQPGQPVVMTSLSDDSVGAGLGLDGRALTNTDEGVFTRPLRTNERGSFQIDLNFGPVIRQHPEMVAGVERAARQWEKLFEDPVTVTIDVELDSPALTDADGRTAGTYVIPDQDVVQELFIVDEQTIEVGFDRVVGGLKSDAGDHESFVDDIPDFDTIDIAFPNTPENPFSLSDQININTANYKAIFGTDVPLDERVPSVFDADEATDGSILLNEGALSYTAVGVGPDFYDLDRSDGLQAGSVDFVGIVGSAIGEVLGFRSSIEDVRLLLQPQNAANPRDITLTPFDLFRLEPGSGSSGFDDATRTLDPDQQSHVFYDGGVFDPSDLPRELRLEQGDIPLLVDDIQTSTISSNAFVTGYEVPENLNGFYVGIGQPVYENNFEYFISDQDRSVFDLIGYDVVGNPLSGDWRGVSFQTYSHDSNVAVITEFEDVNDGEGSNNISSTAQNIGAIAGESKDADENLRVALEVHGYINNPSDVDIYSFDALPGTEIWLDIDRTSQSLDSVVELVDANGVTLARSDNSLAESLGDEQRFENGVFTFNMSKSIFLSQDHYSVNPLDAGFRVVLPGNANSAETATYFVRVRSSGPNISQLQGGLTEGRYELQIRTRELDEVPGSSVQFADIRYAVDGIRISGLPRHSPLTGEVIEDGSPNDTFGFDPLTPDAFQIYNSNVLRPFGIASAGDDPDDIQIEDLIGVEGGEFAAPQYIGNVLTSDQSAISIAGNLTPLASTIDVDYYMFTVDFDAVQTTGSFTPPTTVNLMFDVDYADGLGRADTTLYVYDAVFPFDFRTEFDVQLGTLRAIGSDSGDLDDLPAPAGETPGAGTGLDDLSRGSVGRLDPMLGPVTLTEGAYILAIAPSSLIVNDATSQFEDAQSSNPLIRHEPVTTLERVVDQDFDFPYEPEPELPVLLDGSGFVPFSLSDVTLFVSSPGAEGSGIWTVDPYLGGVETFVGTLLRDPDADDDNGGGGGGDGALADIYNVGDIVLAERQAPRNPLNDDGRVDEQLFGFTLGDTDANSGNYLVIDPGTAFVSGTGQADDTGGGGGGGNNTDPEDTSFSDDQIVTYIVPEPDTPDAEPQAEAADEGVQFEALALQQLGRRNYVGYAVGSRNDPSIDNILYLYDHGSGLALSDPGDDREDTDLIPAEGLEEFFGYSNIVERGVLHTEADYDTPGGSIIENDSTALIVPAASEADGTPIIEDGMSITVSNDGTPVIFEFDTSPEVIVSADPAGGTFASDGQTFVVGDTIYEVETGPVLVFDSDLSSYSQGDQIFIADIRPKVPALLLELTADGSTSNVNAVAIDLNVADSTTLADAIVEAINSSNRSAVARRVGDRISLEYEGNIASTTDAIVVDGAVGLNEEDAIAIELEESFTSTQVVDALLNTVPGAYAQGNRVGFGNDDFIEFSDFDSATSLDVEPGVTPGNTAINFRGTFSAEDMARVIAGTAGGRRGGNVVALTQGQNQTFDASPSGFEIGGQSPGGKITGMTFVGGRLLGVSDAGGLFEIKGYNVPEGAVADYIETSAALEGIRFSGLTLGPADLAGGAYADMLFATDRAGNLHAFSLDGTPQAIFANGATSVPTGVAGANGLEFSTLQDNIWGLTDERAADLGHGDPLAGGNSLLFGGDRDFFYPGGAQGTIVSNEIDLSDYTSDDLPALYFTYFFVAEESEQLDDPNINRDAFRVFISDDSTDDGKGEWVMLATSDVARPDGVEPLFTNSYFDIPRLTRDAQFFEDIDDLEANDPDLVLGPSGDRDTFPFRGEVETDDPPTPRNPFPENANIADDEWDPFAQLDERNGVWRQAKIDLRDFAGSDSLRLRFDFSTAASFDLGGFGGVELKAVDADKLEDGDTLVVGGETFEVDLGLSILSPAGTSISEGETIMVLDNEGNSYELELTSDEFITEGNVPVNYTTQSSAIEVAAELSAALGDLGLSHTVLDNRITLDADNAFPAENSLFQISGGGLDEGVAEGNIAIELDRTMSGNEVAAILSDVLAQTLAGGDEQAFPETNNLVRIYGVDVDDPGPFGLAVELPGDNTGAFTNAPGTPAYRGLENQYRYYDFDDDDEIVPEVLNPNLRDPDADDEDQPEDFAVFFEGLYIDDLVIGFRARGEVVTDHREFFTYPITPDWDIPPFDVDERVPDIFAYTSSDSEVGFSDAIVTGEYQAEIRVATHDEISLNKLDRAVPNTTLLSPKGAQLFDGKTFQINDGLRTVTFEYNDLALGAEGDVATGNVAVDFNTSDTDFEVAVAIRDAVNVSGLTLTATTADGGVNADVVSSGSNRVNLFGNAVVLNQEAPNGIEYLVSEVEAAGNRNRDQGQLIIAQSRVTNSEGHGIIVEDALRDLPSYEWADPDGLEQHAQFQEGDYTPQPGPIRNLREINQEVLTTGVVIANNVVAFNELGGIKYGGDPNGYILTAPFGKNPPNDNLEVWDNGGINGQKFTITDHNDLSRTFEFHDLTQNNPGVPGTDWAADSVPIFFQRDDFQTPLDSCLYQDCEGRYTVEDLDMADRIQEAIERSNLDVNVYRGKGDELFVEGAAFIGVRPNDVPSAFIESFVSRVQTGAVPFGRIVNNTVVGLGGRFTDTRVDELTSIDPNATEPTFLRVVNDYKDVGIDIGDNADPTLMNNVIVNFEVGMSTDFTALDTVRNGMVFQGNNQNTQNTNVGDFAVVLGMDDPLFVDPLNGNFYPAANSTIIDSSIDSLEDRPSLVTVKDPIGIARSPIIAPSRDALGQLREDDPNVEPQNGQGRNAFKDRGAIDRVDFVGPRVSLLTPRDNDAEGIDENPAETIVSLDPENTLESFEIQFFDSSQLGDTQDGTGLDPVSITGDSVTITRDGTPLTAGTDFEIDVDVTNGVLRLLPTTGTWPVGSVYRISLDETVRDIAGNPLQDNQPGGGVAFTIAIQLGTDFGDAPEGYPIASHDILNNFYLGTSVTPEPASLTGPDAANDTGDNGVLLPEEFERNTANSITVQASASGVLDAWFDFNRDGDWNDAGERVFAGVSLTTGANELSVSVPSGALSGQTFARFRFSNSGSPTAGGHVLSGEVEDYAVFVDLGTIWQNPENPNDVNVDGSVSPIDVLRIIQEINSPMASDPVTFALPAPAVEPNTPETLGFVDVNGDGFVTARDALLVIQTLNAGVSGEPANAALLAASEPITVDPISEIIANPVVVAPPPAPQAAVLEEVFVEEEDEDLVLAVVAERSSNDVDDVFADLGWIDDADM